MKLYATRLAVCSFTGAANIDKIVVKARDKKMAKCFIICNFWANLIFFETKKPLLIFFYQINISPFNNYSLETVKNIKTYKYRLYELNIRLFNK